ncbi:MAG: GHKL domain-containing protein [Lachnospiraceae bacterium]|nr:GHKL domain-containing protein [Lachnospiraceae bacterium]
MIYILFCLLVVVVLGVCIIIILWHHMRLKKEMAMLEESFMDLRQLNFELRSVRHDYLNHLQVVYGLLELEEYDELKSYLKPVYKEMMKTGKALKTSKPALNALLMAKMKEAETQGIDVYVEVKSDLKHLSPEVWQLCKVLSNLLDNAMAALKDVMGEKKIEVDINETKEDYVFLISDNGPGIPEQLQEAIFKRGFTTKKESGHGMGLAIVSEILKENNGRIQVNSVEGRTTFTVMFRKGGS